MPRTVKLMDALMVPVVEMDGATDSLEEIDPVSVAVEEIVELAVEDHVVDSEALTLAEDDGERDRLGERLAVKDVEGLKVALVLALEERERDALIVPLTLVLHVSDREGLREGDIVPCTRKWGRNDEAGKRKEDSGEHLYGREMGCGQLECGGRCKRRQSAGDDGR